MFFRHMKGRKQESYQIDAHLSLVVTGRHNHSELNREKKNYPSNTMGCVLINGSVSGILLVMRNTDNRNIHCNNLAGPVLPWI